VPVSGDVRYLPSKVVVLGSVHGSPQALGSLFKSLFMPISDVFWRFSVGTINLFSDPEVF